MDTVLAPFLDTYHRNIQNSYQQLTSKILRRIKDEINAALQKKQQIYQELTQLADDLKVPRNFLIFLFTVCLILSNFNNLLSHYILY